MALFATSPAARTALIYITAGAQILIWTTVWLIYLMNHPPQSSAVYYWVSGLFASGFVLMSIGFGVGYIGRAAQKAEVPNKVVPTVPVAQAPAVPPAQAPPAVAEPAAAAPPATAPATAPVVPTTPGPAAPPAAAAVGSNVSEHK